MPWACCEWVHQRAAWVQCQPQVPPEEAPQAAPWVRGRCIAPSLTEATQTHTQKEPLQHIKSLALSTQQRFPRSQCQAPQGCNLSITSQWHLNYRSTRSLTRPFRYVLCPAASQAASQGTTSRFSAWPSHTKQWCCWKEGLKHRTSQPAVEVTVSRVITVPRRV